MTSGPKTLSTRVEVFAGRGAKAVSSTLLTSAMTTTQLRPRPYLRSRPIAKAWPIGPRTSIATRPHPYSNWSVDVDARSVFHSALGRWLHVAHALDDNEPQFAEVGSKAAWFGSSCIASPWSRRAHMPKFRLRGSGYLSELVLIRARSDSAP
jgi:hypothetical protein